MGATAIKIRQDNLPEVMAFTKELGDKRVVHCIDPFHMEWQDMHEAPEVVEVGKVIIRGVDGDFFVVTEERYDQTYSAKNIGGVDYCL